MADSKPLKAYFKYIFGGLAGMAATFFVQPLDLIKTRMQLAGTDGGRRKTRTPIQEFNHILRHDGVLGLYKGLDAGLLRQATYTTTRLGVYTKLNELHWQKYERSQRLMESLGIGCVSGAVGAFVGTPAELALIRLTANNRRSGDNRHNYKSAFHAISRIVQEEGVLALWKGCMPTMSRAIVVNMAQLATYTQIKVEFLKYPIFHDGIILHFCASMISGFVTTLVSIPVDMAKTRIQNQLPDPHGNFPYRGSIDVFTTIIRDEGFLKLWKGFTPYFARLGPHTILTFIFMEQLIIAYNKYAS